MEPTDYAKLADSYRTHRRLHPQVFSRLVAAASSADSVLEVGCGTGNYVRAIREAVGCRAVGLDPAPTMLAHLRAQSSDVLTVEGWAERLGFANDQFSFVYSVDVIHHVTNRVAAFREARRVLRPGGKLCIVTDSEPIIRERDPLSVYFPETVEIELVRYPTIETLRAELQRSGFFDLREELVEHEYDLRDAAPFRQKTFSSLLHLSESVFERGLSRLEADLGKGPRRCVSRYLMLWATKPEAPGERS